MKNDLISDILCNYEILGRLNADITQEFLSHLSEDEQAAIADKKEELFRQLAKEKLQPTKGLKKIIEYIEKNRSKLKIGKNKFEDNCQRNLRLFFLFDRFSNECSSISC